MSAVRGGASYLRFVVDVDPPARLVATYERAIEARRFVALSPPGSATESAGFAPIDDPLDDDVPLTRPLFIFGALLAIAYREDKIAIPRALVEHHARRRLAELEAAGEKIDARVKKAVLAMVHDELRKRTMPKTRVVELVWDMPARSLRVFGRGPMATERAAGLFERTFGVAARLAHYGSRAFTGDLSLRARAILESLAPEPFFPSATGRLDEADA